jgi:hypothetical protein
MTSLNEIEKDIAIEFGFEAIGYGLPKITSEQLTNAQRLFNALSVDEQNEIVNNYFRKLGA